MARPKKKTFSLAEKIAKAKASALPQQLPEPTDVDQLRELPDRIRAILGLAREAAQNPTDMLYLVMYDIEDNRVRTHIAKYLLSKGCIRIQKSVYLARSNRRIFEEINTTLAEVQQAYDNHDSILLVPVPSEHVSSMKIIGKDIQIQSLVDPPNTLFY